jgi:flavorubredoxin
MSGSARATPPPRRFDEEIPKSVWRPLALNYFANILTPYAAQIAKILQAATSSGLVKDIKIIRPDPRHGLAEGSNARPRPLRRVVQRKPSAKAAIAFDSMWRSTERMARELTDTLGSLGIEAHFVNLKHSHRGEVATAAYEAGAILVGSPTINNQMFPSVADLLRNLKSLKTRNRVGAAFGSHGWSGEGAKLVQAELGVMGHALPSPEIRVQWVPDEKDLDP